MDCWYARWNTKRRWNFNGATAYFELHIWSTRRMFINIFLHWNVYYYFDYYCRSVHITFLMIMQWRIDFYEMNGQHMRCWALCTQHRIAIFPFFYRRFGNFFLDKLPYATGIHLQDVHMMHLDVLFGHGWRELMRAHKWSREVRISKAIAKQSRKQTRTAEITYISNEVSNWCRCSSKYDRR